MKGKKNEGARGFIRRVVGTIMTRIKAASKHSQISVKEGIKRFGQRAILATLKEYAQLNDRRTFAAIDPNKLTIE